MNFVYIYNLKRFLDRLTLGDNGKQKSKMTKIYHNEHLTSEELQKRKNPIFKKFEQLVEKGYSEERNVSNYANNLHIHPYCLNKVCKLSVDKTASEIIHNRVLQEAKKMILESDKSFKEIAYQLNFNSAAYFSRYFKKHIGINPTEFKNNSFGLYK